LFQISQWGEDAEAAARTKAHKAEFDAAAEVLTLLG
jgi:chaperone required for assembly of F1-ATPase